MSHRLTTARTRELGTELRRLREKSGYNTIELAKQLGWAPSTVSRVETGVRAISETNLVQFAATVGATPPQQKHLKAVWGEGRNLGYWLTDRFSSMLFHESTALSTVAYQPVVVPGMLQTREYATTLNRASGVTEDENKYWADARLARQDGLPSRPSVFFIHEQALRLPVGGKRVMNEQLLKLALLVDQPGLSIRVVPIASGAHSVFDGEFSLHQYAAANPVVSLCLGSLMFFMEDRSYVARYAKQTAALSRVALSTDESRELIAGLAYESDQPASVAEPPTPIYH